MKTVITALTLSLLTSISYGQTNRINHFSHSGSKATLGIFADNDNMGLGCGTPIKEYEPVNEKPRVCVDSVKIDTTKKSIETPFVPAPPPRRGMSLERRISLMP